MKKNKVDILFIVFLAGSLILLNHFNVISRYPQYALIPLLAVYYFGQFIERNFKN